MSYQPLPAGTGFEVPKGADIALQIHYHRNGRVEHDRTRVGLYFAKGPVTRPFHVLPLAGFFTSIPAGAERYQVEGRMWVDQDITIHHLMPHMHLLGKDIKATLTTPDGRTRTLIAINDWDFNWQEFYYLKEPIKVPAGSRFNVTATYDNSDRNPLNPNRPPRRVFVGEQTTNEMCFVFMGFTPEKPGALVLPWLLPPKNGVRTTGLAEK
jgi:hypothetical protein